MSYHRTKIKIINNFIFNFLLKFNLIKSGHQDALRVMYWFGLKVLPKVKMEDGTDVHIDLPSVVEPCLTQSSKLESLQQGYDLFEERIG